MEFTLKDLKESFDSARRKTWVHYSGCEETDERNEYKNFDDWFSKKHNEIYEKIKCCKRCDNKNDVIYIIYHECCEKCGFKITK